MPSIQTLIQLSNIGQPSNVRTLEGVTVYPPAQETMADKNHSTHANTADDVPLSRGHHQDLDSATGTTTNVDVQQYSSESGCDSDI